MFHQSGLLVTYIISNYTINIITKNVDKIFTIISIMLTGEKISKKKLTEDLKSGESVNYKFILISRDEFCV